MNALPNSRKLNGVSLVEYLQEDSNGLVVAAANADDQYDYPIDLTQKEQEAILRKRYHHHSSSHHGNVKKHAVSKVHIYAPCCSKCNCKAADNGYITYIVIEKLFYETERCKVYLAEKSILHMD